MAGGRRAGRALTTTSCCCTGSPPRPAPGLRRGETQVSGESSSASLSRGLAASPTNPQTPRARSHDHAHRRPSPAHRVHAGHRVRLRGAQRPAAAKPVRPRPAGAAQCGGVSTSNKHVLGVPQGPWFTLTQAKERREGWFTTWDPGGHAQPAPLLGTPPYMTHFPPPPAASTTGQVPPPLPGPHPHRLRALPRHGLDRRAARGGGGRGAQAQAAGRVMRRWRRRRERAFPGSQF